MFLFHPSYMMDLRRMLQIVTDGLINLETKPQIRKLHRRNVGVGKKGRPAPFSSCLRCQKIYVLRIGLTGTSEHARAFIPSLDPRTREISHSVGRNIKYRQRKAVKWDHIPCITGRSPYEGLNRIIFPYNFSLLPEKQNSGSDVHDSD